MAGHSSKKGKMPDKRPARSKYWACRALEKRKVKQIMRYHRKATYDSRGVFTGNRMLTKAEAAQVWKKSRGVRRTPWTDYAAAI